mgnify:FL=1
MKKQIILIGEGCWFIDSFLYFREHGFDIKVIKTKNSLIWFKDNYDILKNFDAEIVKFSDDKKFYEKLSLSPDTIVIGGGNFGGDIPSVSEFKAIGLEELDILYKVSKYNSDNKSGAKIIRTFNGDTGFGSKEMVNIFNKKIKYTDILIFDNNLLKEFVLTNIPEARKKKTLLGWLETPLERYVYHNTSSKYDKSFVSVGRILCSLPLKYKKMDIIIYPNPHMLRKGKLRRFFTKLKHCLVNGRKLSYSLAGRDSYQHILEDRKNFYKTHKQICFGLSHFYDIFRGSVDDYHKNKKYYFTLKGQVKTQNPYTIKEANYAFINNPSKDIGYLMNGIIPLISHAEHNVYKEMLKNKMAILIKTPEDINKVLNMSNEEIQEYRDNIYKNRALFTFDHVGEMILNELY